MNLHLFHRILFKSQSVKTLEVGDGVEEEELCYNITGLPLSSRNTQCQQVYLHKNVQQTEGQGFITGYCILIKMKNKYNDIKSSETMPISLSSLKVSDRA